MADLLKYKSFAGTVEYSAADKCLYGQIVGIPDRIIYEGADLDELQKYFKQAVIEYIKDCERLGKAKMKTYTGHFSVRLKPKTHEKLDYLAHSSKTSVSRIIEEAVSRL
jgi:predicted HicB family RNase H-like nuclease